MPAIQVEKERRTYFSVANVLTILGMLGALAASYATLSADNADTKRRVTHLEHGEQKTHQLIKENAKEIKSDIAETKQNVNLILQEIRAMQAVQRDRDRRERREQ